MSFVKAGGVVFALYSRSALQPWALTALRTSLVELRSPLRYLQANLPAHLVLHPLLYEGCRPGGLA